MLSGDAPNGRYAMGFEFKTVTEDGTPVVLRFKPYGDSPGRISRRNINNMEAQVWQYLEWGLIEPKNWPEDSDSPGTNVLDVVPQRDITKCYQEWQSADDEKEEKEEKKPEIVEKPKDLGS
jgi:hypothetical protein